jgi:Flp pilus assembly protein TadD
MGAATAIAVATGLVYAQVLTHDFVNWDDPDYVAQNPVVSRGITAAGVVWAFTHQQVGNWHPITSLSHMLDCELFGLWPGGHHLTSVALHLLSTWLLLGLLVAMTGAPGASAFVAAVFALHPLRVESVAWVAERKDVLAGVFWMLALWGYHAWVRRPDWRRHALLVITFGLGLLAKPMLVTLPAVLLLLDFWPLRRPEPLRRRLVEKLPLLALAAGASVLAVIMQRRSGGLVSLQAVGLESRLANALAAYGWYAGKTLWPAGLAAFYPLHLPVSAWQAAAGGLLVAVLGTLVWALRGSRPWMLVGWSWYLVTLLPVIGLVRVGEQAVADRYTYLPGIGLSIVVAWGAVDCIRARPRLRAPLAAVAVGIAVVLGAASRVQVGYWRDSVTLYRRALDVTRDNHVAHTNLGSALLAQGQVAGAMEHYQAALRLRPNEGYAHANVALALAARGQRDAALAEYARALDLAPGNAGTHVRVADLLAEGGRVEEAIGHYEQAVKLDPDSALAHNNLAYLLAAAGSPARALEHYRAALRLDPDLAEVHGNLAQVLERLGERDEALDHHATAVRLAPDHLQLRLDYASCLARAGRRNEAITELRETLRRQPGWEPAERALATLLGGRP